MRARGEAQDVGAKLIRRCRSEVSKLNVRILPSDVDLELRRAEQPGDERLGDVDALNAVEATLAVRAEQHAAAHLDDLVRDSEAVHAPRQKEPEHEECESEQNR